MDGHDFGALRRPPRHRRDPGSRAGRVCGHRPHGQGARALVARRGEAAQPLRQAVGRAADGPGRAPGPAQEGRRRTAARPPRVLPRSARRCTATCCSDCWMRADDRLYLPGQRHRPVPPRPHFSGVPGPLPQPRHRRAQPHGHGRRPGRLRALPYVNTMAAFAASRALEAIKIDIAYNGCRSASWPPTAVSPPATSARPTRPWRTSPCMRVLPGFTVVVPADAGPGRPSGRARALPGPSISGSTGKPPPGLTARPRSRPLQIGRAQTLRRGGDAGAHRLRPAPGARRGGRRRPARRAGHRAAVLNLHTLRPSTPGRDRGGATGSARVVTVEEHWRSRRPRRRGRREPSPSRADRVLRARHAGPVRRTRGGQDTSSTGTTSPRTRS